MTPKEQIQKIILETVCNPAAHTVTWDQEKSDQAAQQAEVLTDEIWQVLLTVLKNPPRHDYWAPGDSECPRDIKASNGELHTMQCRTCGQPSPRSQICFAKLEK